MKLRIKLLLVLFNLLVLSGYGQERTKTVFDTIEVESIVISKIDHNMKRIIDDYLRYMKEEESYCGCNKNVIMMISLLEFDSINQNKYIELIDFTENKSENKYIASVSLSSKIGELVRELNNPTNKYFYYKFNGLDVYIYAKLDVQFQNKGKKKLTTFHLKYDKFINPKNGKLYYDNNGIYENLKPYEMLGRIYKLDNESNR